VAGSHEEIPCEKPVRALYRTISLMSGDIVLGIMCRRPWRGVPLSRSSPRRRGSGGRSTPPAGSPRSRGRVERRWGKVAYVFFPLERKKTLDTAAKLGI
jgi:hypothetical protein